MANYNRVFLMGNLTRDPEIRYTPSGMAVASFGLAINHRWKDKTSGEMREEVTFVDIDAWGRNAELAGQYLAKGRPLFVEGRLKLDSWEDKNTGQKRSKLKVVCERFQFLGTRGDAPGGGAGAPGGGGSAPAQRPAGRPAPAKPAPGGAQGGAQGGGPEAPEGADENFEVGEDIPF